MENGKFMLKYINPKTGVIEIVNKTINGAQNFDLLIDKDRSGVYWFQKI